MTATPATETPQDHYLPWGDPQFKLDPYPWYARLQREQPVYHMADGTYVLSRYEDVMRCLRHPAMTVVPGWETAGPWSVNRETVVGADEPEHTRLRRHTNKWFTPKLVADWVNVTELEIHRSIDAVGPDGVVEAWQEFCVRPTHVTMARVLGFPEEGAREVSEAMGDAMAALAATATPEEVNAAARAFAWLGDQVDTMLEQRRAQPGDKLADALLAAADRGEMTAAEVRGTVLLFYGIGHLDIGYLVASALHQFTLVPELFEAYKARPDLRKAIINEMIRLDPAELSIFRHCLEDVEFNGVTIPAGSQIRCMIGAANRDPAVFENPDMFDYTRPPEASMNLSFGAGIHHCAGQVLTRAEAEVILTAVADRYDSISLAGAPETHHQDFARIYASLPLKLGRASVPAS